ncbi:hypothetical protein evm_012346 [Chilo suppressalis]|nr:hypothetical protein evm_012346 [Chilo suppressalis]
MATVLDLVKHYQHAIEKYPNDEQRVLKSIDKLFNLDVTVQHLQDTGVGRTVNALRKEPGNVGQAARALVCKWKLMVAAEESDHDGDQNPDTNNYNGHDNGRDSDDNVKKSSNNKQDYNERALSKAKSEYKQENGHHSGNKRKNHSSEEEEPDVKKSKSSSSNHYNQQKANMQIKRESTESGTDDSSDQSHSESDMSEYSEDEKPTKKQVKQEQSDHYKSKHSSSYKDHGDHRKDSSSSKQTHDSEKHGKSRSHSESIETTSSEKTSTKEKSHSSYKSKSSKDKENSTEKSSKTDHSSSGKDKHKEEPSSSKHRSSSDKHKSSKSDSSNEKHNSSTDKYSEKTEKIKSSSYSHKSDKDKSKSSSGKETSIEKEKCKESRSSKEKHSSSSKERSKDRSSSSKEKSENSHKSEKKHSSSDSKSKHSEKKHKSEKKDESNSESKSKHKSSSFSLHASKSSKDKSKEDIPKKKPERSADSDDGINCESGASFAEALGMISPVKPKKKVKSQLKDVVSPNLSNSDDLSPASLLAPTAKLAPLPALEISALPEISPNYKPRPPPKLLPHFTEEEAMSAVISSKNQRTKVYSGNKVIGKIPTLYEMCVQVLQEHIDALEYTGGVPYDILKPVVDRATPQQLFMLEHYNPYLMEDTDHLWHKFCEKNFRSKQRQELETWREMYMRCQEEQEHRLKSLTANIKIAQEKAKAPIKQTKMAYVDTVVKPPRNVARKQALHGTAFAASASPAARVSSLASAPNVMRGNTRPTLAAPQAFNNKPKKAPLMQKALQFMRGRKR